MNWWQQFDLSIIGPPFIAGLIVLATHVPFGREVIKRGIIFIDLAIAQIAGLGVIGAYQLGWHQAWSIQLSAAVSALLAAAMFKWMEKRFARIQEALIGISFVLAATASILVLSNNPHGAESLKDLLVGQILWVDTRQIVQLLVVSVILMGIFFSVSKKYKGQVFYLLFALAVTNSVQVVGVYLVFASLIIPALASYQSKKPLWSGFLIGSLGYALGLALSSLFDLPSGAIIVWSISFVASVFVGVCSYKECTKTTER